MKIDNILARVGKKVNSLVVADFGASLKLSVLSLSTQSRLLAQKSFALTPRDKEAEIIKNIRSFLQDNNLAQAPVILEPFFESVLIKRLQLPGMPRQELPEAIKWQIKDEVSFNLQQAVLDFVLLREGARQDGSKFLDVISAIADAQQISSQVSLLKAAGLNCLAVTPKPFAYAKVSSRLPIQDKDNPVGILHIDEDKIFIAVYLAGKLEFSRLLPGSINKFKESLSGALATDRGIVNLTVEEANSIIFEHGLKDSKDELYKDKIVYSQVLAMIREGLDRMAQEVKRSLAFYVSQFQGKPVGNIFISGPGAKVPELDSFLSRESGLSFQRIPAQNFGDDPSAVGLGIDYEHNLSLLPHEFRAEKFEKIQKFSLRWLAIIASSVLLLAFIFAKAGENLNQGRLDQAKKQLIMLSEIKGIKANLDQIHNFVSKTRAMEVNTCLLLKKISMLVPREVFFNNLSVDPDKNFISISGLVRSANNSPDLVLMKVAKDLEGSGYFSDVDITSVEKIQDSLVRFLLRITVR